MNAATERIYEVKGMTCAHCEASVAEEVEQVQGVTAIDADRETGRLTIRGLQRLGRRQRPAPALIRGQASRRAARRSRAAKHDCDEGSRGGSAMSRLPAPSGAFDSLIDTQPLYGIQLEHTAAGNEKED